MFRAQPGCSLLTLLRPPATLPAPPGTSSGSRSGTSLASPSTARVPQDRPSTGSGAQLGLQPHNHSLEETQVTLEVALPAQPLGTDDDKGSAHCTPAPSGAWEG